MLSYCRTESAVSVVLQGVLRRVFVATHRKYYNVILCADVTCFLLMVLEGGKGT